MEQKKINLSMIFATIIFALSVAYKSLIVYFGGAGIPFVACLVLAGLVLTFGATKKENARHLIEIFIMLALVMITQLILFMGYDWALTMTHGVVKFRNVCCNILSSMSLFFLAYSFIRLLFELSNKRFVVSDALLGLRPHKTHDEKIKKYEKKTPKEIKNGDFSEKPNELETIKDNKDEELINKNNDENSTPENENINISSY